MFKLISLKNGLDNVDGFYSDGINAGLKNKEKDLAFIRSDKLCDVSSIFTSNKFQAAPIKHFKKYPKNFKTNFVLINSKNANAMTSKKGIEDIDEILTSLKETNPNIVNPLMSSTGVIGYRLPKEKITNALKEFDFNAKNSNAAAQAIMTTDTFQKDICFKVTLQDGSSFFVAAICKGAGMINPAMATMLCFIVTDADIPKNDMDELLKSAVENSFNKISVDGDTSTNDTVMLLANKKSGIYDKQAFKAALDTITKELALLILKDGEGSNKVVAFEVKNAASKEDAKKAATMLSNSLLVKTALFGEDPNWGRVGSTIGASGIICNEEKLTISYDNVTVYEKGINKMDNETEKKAAKVLSQESFKITCDIGMGEFSYTAYGCDLSYEYVKINADYRT
jgi:glutamate N-acetyltransferase/amino-acid N-acetyltransferase